MGLGMKKILMGAVGVAVLAGAGMFGYDWWTTGRFMESTDNAYVEADISVISPKVEGYVREVRTAENQLVKAGDVLVTIGDADYAAKLAEAAATVEARRAAIGSIDSKLQLERSLIESAAATLESANADRARVAKDLERYQQLLSNDHVSRRNYDLAVADMRKGDAAVLKAEAALAAERQQIAVLEASRKEAQAALHQAEAALETARLNLENTVIRAPVDGVVGNRGVQVGQYVRAGTQLLSVVPLPDVHVVANFKETQLEAMRPGQTVEITIDAFPSTVLHGRVESFAPASGSQFSLLPPENATGNFTKIVQRVPVRVAIPRDNPLAGLLRPGLSVEAAVDTRTADKALTLVGGVFGAISGAAAEQVAEQAEGR
jgi:membrane fusion protein (multidrug efflux system)